MLWGHFVRFGITVAIVELRVVMAMKRLNVAYAQMNCPTILKQHQLYIIKCTEWYVNMNISLLKTLTSLPMAVMPIFIWAEQIKTAIHIT